MARTTAVRWTASLLFVLLFAAIGLGCEGEQGPPGPPGPQGEKGEDGDFDPSTAVEGCVGCHLEDGLVPVGDIGDVLDAHYVDLDLDGPLTPSGYRQLQVTITQVDLMGSVAIVDFTVEDENGAAAEILAEDGRFNVARLDLPVSPGDPTSWTSLLFSETFTTSGGFEKLVGANYRYTSSWDPTTIPVATGDTLRVAVQISSSELPAGNGWCDFDFTSGAVNADCDSASLTRDIVQTDTCNGCHGVTSDTWLAFHRDGGRTEVEYCVTCHNPGLGDADMTVMIHKIHYGANLENGYREYSNVHYTKDIDDCTTCHTGGGADVQNWATQPNIDSCGSCHDSVDFQNGVNHGQQQDNSQCADCHPPLVPVQPDDLPVMLVHTGVARSIEGARYRGPQNGFELQSVVWDQPTDQLTILYSVKADNGTKMMLESDREWTAPAGASRLAITIGWPTVDYTNEGSGSAPAQPVSYDALDIPGTATALGGGDYQLVVDVPSGAFGTATVGMEGHPAADLNGNFDGEDVYADRIAVRNVYSFVNVDQRGVEEPRSDVIDIARCNECHDSAGAGVSLHGNNRTSEMQVCVVCHNADATDVRQRPADPNDSLDGKKEETVDAKRMVHQIHAGKHLQNGLVIYGFGNTAHDFSFVGFTGNLANCETCHFANTYATDDVVGRLPTTIDTGEDRDDPSDDLNISTIASLCSSCHDDDVAREHMLLNGASFHALDEDIR